MPATPNDIFRTARVNRDRNFDGQFFFGVRTTGIFCRPSCPSPRAREENVEYFDTVFAAMEKGFRPCLRCRPDMAVAYSSRNGTGMAVVDTALRLIYDGYLNDHTLGDLAAALSISKRHLRKVFVDNLGVPPVKIARYHKVLFAKKLLLVSRRTMADIAFASGFGSIRQFNETFKALLGDTPTATRQQLGSLPARDKTTLFLRYDTPFDFQGVLDFIRPRAIKGVELVRDGTYWRTFRTADANGYFSVRDNQAESALELSIECDDIKCYMAIHNRVRRMFDLDTNFAVINALFAKDRRLSRGLTGGHAPRLPLAFSPFEAAIRGILGQQVTVRAATTLTGRVVGKASLTTGSRFPEGLDYYFPDATEILTMDLDGLGITASRQLTLQTAARAVADETVSLAPDQPLEDFCRQFTAIRGIGAWTANYVAMRGLGMKDAFPAADLGIIKAMAGNRARASVKDILKQSEKWSPYRAYAALCLWKTLEET